MFWKKDKIKQIEKINKRIVKYEKNREKFRHYAKKTTEWINQYKQEIKQIEMNLSSEEWIEYIKK